MKTEKLIDQLELYSNAVVGFVVAQSIGFSFTFGTNAEFSCEITKYKLLSVALATHFVLSTVLAAWALLFLQHRIVKLSGENGDTLRIVYRAKIVIAVLFAVIPVGLLLTFGLFGDYSKGRCAKVAAIESVRIHLAVNANVPPSR
jgi:hypothetical protein